MEVENQMSSLKFSVKNPITASKNRLRDCEGLETEKDAFEYFEKEKAKFEILLGQHEKKVQLTMLAKLADIWNNYIEALNDSYAGILGFESDEVFSIEDCYNALIDKREYYSYIAPEAPNRDEIYCKFNVLKEPSALEMFSKSKKTARLEKLESAQNEYEMEMKNYTQKELLARKNFDEKKANFDKIQREFNKRVQERQKKFHGGDSREIEYVLGCYLNQVTYGLAFDKILRDVEYQYLSQDRTVIVSRRLPSIEDISDIAEFKLIKSSFSITEKKMKESDRRKLFDDIVFQVALKTMKDIYDIFGTEIVQHIVFNGWVEAIDPSTGNDMTLCVLSVESHADSFLKLNLKNVNYKECIKGLKGIFGSQIANLTPINPIMKINREDKRFVNDVDVSDILMDGFNLATMEWEDFEYLIRQLFEKIFSSGDSEVKVTQASRDGGVDAIAFDSDPIRGGKVVIQAKRYNIVVPVAAVRDLYGTVVHEGAIKGILVTTSNFGRDSYSFVKDKPVTLINGQELLGLMEQYGFENVNIKLRKKT